MLLFRNDEAQWNPLLQNSKSSHNAYKLLCSPTWLSIHGLLIQQSRRSLTWIGGSTVSSTKLLIHFPRDQLISKFQGTDCIEGLWAAIVDLPSTGEDLTICGAAAYQNAAPPMLLQQISRTTTRVVRHCSPYFCIKWRLPGFYVRKCSCLSPCLARFKQFIGSWIYLWLQKKSNLKISWAGS